MGIRIANLYPRELNLYGDAGNLYCLSHRLASRGYKVDVLDVEIGEDIPNFDIMLIGGGQDNEMRLVANDIRKKSNQLSYYIGCGKVIFAVCAGFQLLGEYYKVGDEVLHLSSVLPFYTVAGDDRLIGNYAFDTEFGRVVGFENHSGRTFLCGGLQPLGNVVVGYGNNGSDYTEGLKYKNTFCTYAHGPVLPKNPALADALLSKVVGELKPIDDEIEVQCHNSLLKRFV